LILYKVKISKLGFFVLLSFVLLQESFAESSCTVVVTIAIPLDSLNLVFIETDDHAFASCDGSFNYLSYVNGSCVTLKQTFKLLWSNSSNPLSCQQDVTNLVNADGTLTFGLMEQIAILSGKTTKRVGYNFGNLTDFNGTTVEFNGIYPPLLYEVIISTAGSSSQCNYIFGCQDCSSDVQVFNSCVLSTTFSEANSDPNCVALTNCTMEGRNITRFCRTIQCDVQCNGTESNFNDCYSCSDPYCHSDYCSCPTECNFILNLGEKLEVYYILMFTLLLSLIFIF